ncbi:MAG: hypothetical protein AUK35_02220 [Zetaproteobacteria bacterium CG2_30_46_52]|nr:MAG: hypothetical protein AUK35_02220 [Zetaproteobacteria bacterium CG2_30_46_52]
MKLASQGFTLIEVLLAIVVFSLIAAVAWSALGPAGEGFVLLQESRVQVEEQQWIGRQLRRDVSYISASEDKNIPPLLLNNDSRGSHAFDELQMLIRDPMYPGLTLIRYKIDEETGLLQREARSPWSRDNVESITWSLGKVDSFDVEALAADGGWKQVWSFDKPPYLKPKGLRVKISDQFGEMHWNLPILVQ